MKLRNSATTDLLAALSAFANVHTERRSAAARLEMILPLLEFARQARAGRRSALELNSIRINSLDALARYIATQHSISSRTIWRWLRRFRARGYDALATDFRRDRGRSRFFAKHEAAASFVLAHAAAGVSAAQIHRALAHAWPALHRESSRPPAVCTLRAFLRAQRGIINSRKYSKRSNARREVRQ